MTNWLIFLGVIVLVFFLMRRGGTGMGCCGGHSHGDPAGQPHEKVNEDMEHRT